MDFNNMKITWYGLSCVYLEGGCARVLMDPYDKSCGGYVLPPLPADIYTVSHEHYDHNYCEAVSNDDAVRARYGMIEKDVRISSVHTWHDRVHGKDWGPNEVFILDMDGRRIAHLGDLGQELDCAQLAALGHVDMLFIPIGGIYTIDAFAAAKVTCAVNARLTFPIHYYTPHLEGADFDLEPGLDEFIRESGREAVRFDRNWICTDSDQLPDGSIIVLHLD